MLSDSPWTDEVVARLRILRGQGKSYSQIAKALNEEFGSAITRNAVCSKIDRLDLNKPEGPSAPRKLVAPEVKSSGPNPLGNITRAGFGKPPPPEAPRNTAPDDSIALAPKTIHDGGFSRFGCKWPLSYRSAEGDILLCQNATDGHVYCSEHAPYAYSATMPKAARQAQDALTAANRKANAGSQANALVFSPRAA